MGILVRNHKTRIEFMGHAPLPAVWILVLFLFSCFTGYRSHAQTFSDVAEEEGLLSTVQAGSFGNGISFYDFNNDGWDDITIPTYDEDIKFHVNNQGEYESVNFNIPGDGLTRTILWVDYDNDGDLDVFKTTYLGPFKLYENDGEFNFTDVSVEAGLAQIAEKPWGASFGDYDRDGYLDLYVCNFEWTGNENNPDLQNKLYHNNGDGTFTDVTAEAGVGNGIAFSFQSLWFDYNNDDLPDLFVINDRDFDNALYKNNGDGTFTDKAEEAGLRFPDEDPMSISVADFDNDGDLDIFITNSTEDNHHTLLAVNNGDGTFTEMSNIYNLAFTVWSWSAVWIDHNNNTYQDLFIATAQANVEAQPNIFMGNVVGNSFASLGNIFQSENTCNSFGAARGDMDNNGYYDIAVQNRAPHIPYLWKNSGGDNHYIKITLQGTISNHFAIGSWIKVYVGGEQYTQYTFCGENYLSQNSQHHIFGLADMTSVDSVEIEYNSGHIDKYYNLEVDTAYEFTEGETYQAEITYAGTPTFCEGDSLELDAGEHSSYLWNTGDTTRYITVGQSGQYSVTVSNEFGIESTSDTVDVTSYEEPNVTEDFTDPPCAGEQSGSIVLNGPDDSPVIIWDGDFQGDSLTGLPPGIYSYIYIDEFGCQTSGSIALQDPPPLEVKYSSQDADDGDNGQINVTVSGGSAPYEVFLNGEATSMQIDSLGPGVYQVNLVDGNGCEWEEEIVVSDISNLSSTTISPFKVYPNPARDILYIDGPFIQSIEIRDIAGRIIMRPNPAMRSIEMPETTGVYMINIMSEEGYEFNHRVLTR